MDEKEFDKFAEEYRQIHARHTRYSGEGTEFFFEYKIRDVAKEMSAYNGSAVRILDFGAGVGSSVPYFRKYFPQSDLVCTDVSHRSLAIAKSRCIDPAGYVITKGEKLPFRDAQFDLIFSACVFHHIAHDEHMPIFRELFRVLKKNGNIFVFEHNPINPFTVKIVRECPFDENAVLIRAGQMRTLFRRAGFQETMVRYRLFFPGILRVFRGLERFMMWFPLGAQYYVRARRGR